MVFHIQSQYLSVNTKHLIHYQIATHSLSQLEIMNLKPFEPDLIYQEFVLTPSMQIFLLEWLPIFQYGL